MFSRNTTLLLFFFIGAIIVFDAMQQKYYLETFNLAPASGITFVDLLRSHTIRWLLWGLCSLPFSYVGWRAFKRSGPVSGKSWGILSLLVLVCIGCTIVAITFQSFFVNKIPVEFDSFMETMVFMSFQKGLSFAFASSILLFILFSYSRSRVIDAQWVEIKNLKSESTNNSGTAPSISIKIGNKLKLIPVDEITWIESDDYCVKIHTARKAYSLRKSMKSLEKELVPFRFVRVHRQALLNMDYLAHVDFSSSLVKLQDQSELPLSKSGAQVLRRVLDTVTV